MGHVRRNEMVLAALCLNRIFKDQIPTGEKYPLALLRRDIRDRSAYLKRKQDDKAIPKQVKDILDRLGCGPWFHKGRVPDTAYVDSIGRLNPHTNQGYTRTDALAQALREIGDKGATIKELAARSNDLYVEHGGRDNEEYALGRIRAHFPLLLLLGVLDEGTDRRIFLNG